MPSPLLIPALSLVFWAPVELVAHESVHAATAMAMGAGHMKLEAFGTDPDTGRFYFGQVSYATTRMSDRQKALFAAAPMALDIGLIAGLSVARQGLDDPMASGFLGAAEVAAGFDLCHNLLMVWRPMREADDVHQILLYSHSHMSLNVARGLATGAAIGVASYILYDLLKS